MEHLETLVIAIKYGEIHTIASLMNYLLGEFLEGCCEEYCETARLRFNFCWNMLNDVQKQAVIDACPWQSHACEYAAKNNLLPPYEVEYVDEHGITTWKRIRKDPTDLEELSSFPDRIYDFWKLARVTVNKK